MQSAITLFDRLIGRILFVRPQAQQDEDESGGAAKTAGRAFGFSLVISGTRCILQYVVLPFILPIIGIAGELAFQITFVIGIVAIISLVFSLRRFWSINYPYKWHYFFVAVPALIILCVFLYLDLQALAGTPVAT